MEQLFRELIATSAIPCPPFTWVDFSHIDERTPPQPPLGITDAKVVDFRAHRTVAVELEPHAPRVFQAAYSLDLDDALCAGRELLGGKIPVELKDRLERAFPKLLATLARSYVEYRDQALADARMVYVAVRSRMAPGRVLPTMDFSVQLHCWAYYPRGTDSRGTIPALCRERNAVADAAHEAHRRQPPSLSPPPPSW